MKNTLTKIIITGIIIFQFGTRGNSQENNTHILPDKNLAFGAGYSQLLLLDKQVSPLIYKAQFIPLFIEYTKKTNNGIMNLKLELANGFIGPKRFKERNRLIRYPDNNGVFQEYNYTMKNSYIALNEFDFEYLWKIKSPIGEKVKLYAGGQAKQFFSFSYTDVPIFVHSELSINPSFWTSYNLMGLTCQSRLSVFAIGVITNLPYSNNPVDGKHNYVVSTFKMGSEIFSIMDYQRVNFSQYLTKKINNKLSMGLNYKFYWHSSHRHNKNSKAYNNSISVVLSLKLQSNEK